MFAFVVLAAPLSANFRAVQGGLYQARAVAETIAAESADIAGGGVVLVGEAAPHSSLTFSRLSFELSRQKMLVVHFDAKKATLEAPSWILRSAYDIVRSPYNRAITLLDQPTEQERQKFGDVDAFWVGAHPNLIGTRAGELLLLLDILLTDPDHYSQYAIELPGFAARGAPAKTVRDLSVARFMEKILTSPDDYGNYTWTDPHTRYEFRVAPNGLLQWSGTPSYYFLARYGGKNVVQEELTKRFQQNPEIIHNLHPAAFGAAVTFARVCAFFRYVKSRDNHAWNKLEELIRPLPVLKGSTPRVILLASSATL